MAQTGTDKLAATIISVTIELALAQKSVVINTLTDHTTEVGPGMDELDLLYVSSLPEYTDDQNIDGGEIPDLDIAFENTKLILDDWKAGKFTISPRTRIQSVSTFLSTIGRSNAQAWAIYIDNKAITSLLTTTSTKAAPGSPNNKITLDLIAESQQILSDNHVDEDSRYMLITPSVRRQMVGISDFTDASKYGSNTPIMTGEVGRVTNFKTIMTTSRILNPTGADNANALFYHPTCYHHAYQLTDVISAFDTGKSMEQIHFQFGRGEVAHDINNRCHKITGLQ